MMLKAGTIRYRAKSQPSPPQHRLNKDTTFSAPAPSVELSSPDSALVTVARRFKPDPSICSVKTGSGRVTKSYQQKSNPPPLILTVIRTRRVKARSLMLLWFPVPLLTGLPPRRVCWGWDPRRDNFYARVVETRLRRMHLSMTTTSSSGSKATNSRF